MGVLIRTAGPEDAAALAALKADTFRETFLEGFAIPYPPADLAVFEAASHGLQAVAAELADAERTSWVAADATRFLVGYAQVGPCKLPHPDVRSGQGELYQLYVRRDAHKEGIGRRLLNVALDHLALTRPGPIWLGVWSGNERAQTIYRARGFEAVGTYRFPVGSWCDDELIFRRG